MQSSARILVVTTLSWIGLLPAAGKAATITGKVVDTANRAVVAASVMISEVPTTPSKPANMKGAFIRTAADGSFSFDNLDAGTYLLCAQVPRGTLLNTCQWTTALPHVILASATAGSSITLTMRPGYRLPIRVDDPQGLLNAHDGKTPGAHLLVGVQGGYHFETADIDSTDSAGRNISVLVPFDVAVPVTVQSAFFKLQDSAGNAIGKAAALPVTASSAAPTAKLNIKVVGNN
jgi:hypothetical protein